MGLVQQSKVCKDGGEIRSQRLLYTVLQFVSGDE